MKILVVLDDYFNQTNGMCISTQRFVKEFKKQKQEVRILSTSSHQQADYPVPELIIPFFSPYYCQRRLSSCLACQKADPRRS